MQPNKIDLWHLGVLWLLPLRRFFNFFFKFKIKLALGRFYERTVVEKLSRKNLIELRNYRICTVNENLKNKNEYFCAEE